MRARVHQTKSICFSFLYPFFYESVIRDMENKKYDKEYATSFYDEVLYLRKHGIRYEWVYTNEYGVSVWKYKKTYSLWKALAKMYEDKKYEV